jgi:hypothetical protein
MDLLADLLSRDPTRVWSASSAIRTLRDSKELRRLSQHLDQIRQDTNTVQLGGALRPNSSHLKFALFKLAFVAKSEGCLCQLYAADDLFDPNREEKDGNVRVLSRVMLAETSYIDHYMCECTFCDAKHRVEEREYHYTWWAWRPA